MIHIDGSQGEGGGQILRTALSLSLVTGTPFRIDGIRAGRSRPGLMRQHLTALEAAAEVGDADVFGAEEGSTSVTFRPTRTYPGEYRFAVGTAGSTSLVLQTILLPLCLAGGKSRIVLEGGTHNPTAPPYEFLAKAFLPILSTLGPKLGATLHRAGFYPAGGGRIEVTVEPVEHLQPLVLVDRGEPRGRLARAVVARLPKTIAQRELSVLGMALELEAHERKAEEVPSAGPGNVVQLELRYAKHTTVLTSFGEKGTPAELVATWLVERARAYLDSGAAADEHLTDQLLLPMALAGKGTFSAEIVSSHARTNIDVIREFLDVSFAIAASGRGFTVSL